MERLKEERDMWRGDMEALALWFIQYMHQNHTSDEAKVMLQSAVNDWFAPYTESDTHRALSTILRVARDNKYLTAEELRAMEPGDLGQQK